MKNMKIAAAAVVMVMLASAAIVGIGASAYDADENTTTTTTPASYDYNVNLSNNTSVTIELMSNINYYSTFDGASIKWKVTSDNNAIDVSSAGTYTNTDKKVSIKPSVTRDTDQDVKKLTATVTKNEGATTTEFLLEATITVVQNGASVTLSSITYKVTAKIDNVTPLALNDMTFIRNVSGSQALTTGGSSVSLGDSTLFYAIGLPDGLSMTPDGKISGIPTKTAIDMTAKVFIENANGTVFTGDLKVFIKDFEYSVYASATIGAGSTPLGAGTNNTYIIEKGQELSVKTATEGANYISVYNQDPDQDQNGVSKLVKITNNTCDLSEYTTGTGAYKVYIGYADGSSPTSLNKVLASFDLYVVGHVVGIGSDIIIGSR